MPSGKLHMTVNVVGFFFISCLVCLFVTYSYWRLLFRPSHRPLLVEAVAKQLKGDERREKERKEGREQKQQQVERALDCTARHGTVQRSGVESSRTFFTQYKMD